MTNTDLSSYKSLYLQTAKEYIEKITASLGQLLSDVSNKEALNNLHIASHSLKSQSQVMGFTDIADLCLRIEKTSNDILNGIGIVDNTFKVLLKKSVDEIKEMLDKPA